MENGEFRVGDVVRLKSGGPAMTIERRTQDKDHCVCVWLPDQGPTRYLTVPGAALQRTTPDP